MENLDNRNFKTTRLPKDSSPQTKKFDKKYKSEFAKQGMNPSELREVDNLLGEKEQSIKKKIWDLSKMESLVHGDSQLSALYTKMAEEGEDKYGYHYNETIMNILFNEYVMNNPRYLQKYKMAIPKEKKRRDKSGIEQLKQAAHLDDMTKQAMKPKQQQENDVVTHNNSLEGVQSDDMGDTMMDNNLYHGGESGTFDDREYLTHRIEKKYDTMEEPIVREHHLGTREEKIDFILTHKGDIYKAERLQRAPDEQIDDIYRSIEKEMLGVDETTGAASSGSFAAPMGYQKKSIYEMTLDDAKKEAMRISKEEGVAQHVNMVSDNNYKVDDWYDNDTTVVSYENGRQLNETEENVDETTTSSSSGAYVGPFSKKKGKTKGIDTPFWNDGEVLDESNYITNPSKFKKFLMEMEESKLREPELRTSKLREDDMIAGLESPNNDSLVPTEQVDEDAFDNIALDTTGYEAPQYDMEKLKQEKLILQKAQQELLANAKKYGADSEVSKLLGVINLALGTTPQQNNLMQKIQKSLGINEQVPTDEGTGETLGKIGGAIAGGAIGKSPAAAGIGSKIGGAIGSRFDEGVNDELETEYVEYYKDYPSESDFERNGQKYKYVWAKYPSGKVDVGVYNYNQDLVYGYKYFRKNILGIDESMIDNQPNTMANTNGQPKEGSMANYAPPTAPSGVGGNMMEGVKIKDNNPLKGFGDSHKSPVNHDNGMNNIKHPHEPINSPTMKESAELEEDVSQRTKCKSDEEPVKGKSIHEKGGCRKKSNAGEESSKNPYNAKDRQERLRKYEKELSDKKSEYQKELEQNKNHMDKLKNKKKEEPKKKVVEDRKPSSLVMKDRLGKENAANFNSDLKDSNTTYLNGKESELTAQDQITQVPKNPYELGEKIEKQHLATNDGKAFKNAGDSTNDKGDEIPKRNLTSDEEELLNLYRKGQHSWNYDSEPSARFVERMKKDMGEEVFELMKKQMEFIAKAPMYNKDPQPVEDTAVDKVQFDKYKTGWNEKRGLKMEGAIAGKYKDDFGKTKLINFNAKNSQLVESVEGLTPINLDGMGNSYTTRVEENTNMRAMMNAFKFYVNGQGNVKHIKKTGLQSLNEGEIEKKPVNVAYEKMMKLAGYDPSKYTNTGNVKKNRGF